MKVCCKLTKEEYVLVESSLVRLIAYVTKVILKYALGYILD